MIAEVSLIMNVETDHIHDMNEFLEDLKVSANQAFDGETFELLHAKTQATVFEMDVRGVKMVTP